MAVLKSTLEFSKDMKDFNLDFVAVGPQRTGTTWLYEILQDHPEICFPKDVKETMFFEKYYDKGIDWYIKHFTHCKENQIHGEIAPTYFDIETASVRIQNLNPKSKIIINLRSPISRTLSLYRHYLSLGQVNGSFTEAVSQMPRIIEAGRYSAHIPKWLDQFGTEQVKFIQLEDIKSNPEFVIKDVCKFLEISEISLYKEENKKVNATTMPRFPLLAKTLTELAIALRANRLHKFVEFGKSLGLRKVYTGGEDQMLGLTTSDCLHLLEIYEEDTLFIEKLLNQDLSNWRQF